MAPPAEQAGDLYQIVMPAVAITIVSILSFIGAYFKRAAEPEASPAGMVAAKAVGAAFVDDSTAAAILRIDANVAAVAKAVKDRADRERDDEIAERAAEALERRLKGRKDP